MSNDKDQIVFTKDEWTGTDKSTAFGLEKVHLKPKQKVDGVKAILVYDESFKRAKGALKTCSNFRPTLDLPELISAMIDVCVLDADIMKKVHMQIVSQRESALNDMKQQFASGQ